MIQPGATGAPMGILGNISKLWHVSRVGLGKSRVMRVVRQDARSACPAEQVVAPIPPASCACLDSSAGKMMIRARVVAAHSGLRRHTSVRQCARIVLRAWFRLCRGISAMRACPVNSVGTRIVLVSRARPGSTRSRKARPFVSHVTQVGFRERPLPNCALSAPKVVFKTRSGHCLANAALEVWCRMHT